jgi:hypothetical protein
VRGAQLSQEYPPRVDQAKGPNDRKAQVRNGGHVFQLVMVYELSEAHRQSVSWGGLATGRRRDNPSVIWMLRMNSADPSHPLGHGKSEGLP